MAHSAEAMEDSKAVADSTAMADSRDETNKTPKASQLYSHSFFDEEVQASRKLLVPLLVLPIVYTSLLLWVCQSLYLGSTISTSLDRLTVFAVNLDDGAFGQQLFGGIQSSVASSAPYSSLGWVFDVENPSDQASQQLVLDEGAWAVLQVSSNVSSSLNHSLATGTPWNALSTVTVYFASARNQITVNSKVIPSILGVVNPLLAQLGGQHSGQFLGENARNASILQTALQCGSCVTSPYALKQTDLLPFDVPEAVGATMVGMIFLLTFAFTIFQILHVTGQIIGGQLSLSSTIVFRTMAALAAYLVISLWYTVINVIFSIPTNRAFGRGGFLAFWMLNFCTMAALGLPMESLFTVIGLKWAGYFLSFWIIVNVSGAFVSFELMPRFYQYGYAFPFYNSIQGARSIIFGTKNHLGRNFGILIAWMVLGLLGIFIFTAHGLRSNRKKNAHVVI